MLSREADEIGPEEFYEADNHVDELLRDNNFREENGLGHWQADFPTVYLCNVCGATFTGEACDKCVYPFPAIDPEVYDFLIGR